MPRLVALVRKELIRPDRPQLAGEDGFRGDWLDEHGAELVERDEVVGFHLEQAYEAEDCSRLSEKLGASDDVITQMLWRQARAAELAHRGENAEAERLAREAVALAEKTDMLNEHGDALVDLAGVLELADRRNEAARALEEARALRAQGQHRHGRADAGVARRGPAWRRRPARE
jgi:hypothetical protein